jgi:hypothetical protein
MRIFLSALVILSLYNLSSANQKSFDYKVPILFEPNHGQFEPDVRFAARMSHLNLLLTEAGAKIRFPKSTAEIGITAEGSKRSDPIGTIPSKTKIHYFKADESISDVPVFRTAIYKDVYPGIDWLFYEREGLVEFDFVIAPHSDFHRVDLAINGADQIVLQQSGDLILSAQSKELRLHAPIAFQCDAYESGLCTNKQEISAQYKITQDHKISFDVHSYDPERILVIDPKIGYGTLIGGNSFDMAADVTVDPKGNFYVVGYTEANTRIPGNGDAFINKFNPAGELIWSTFIAGSSGENAASIAVNPAGISYVGGTTSSRDFPIVGAFQPNFGGSLDGFIVKLSSNGTIMKSSFLGGSGRETVNEVKLGTGPKLGRGLYLLGNTDSGDFPRKNAPQNQYGGAQDGFLMIVHALNFQQLLSTYVGTHDRDDAISLAINPIRGDLYSTTSNFEGSDLVHFKPLSNAPAPLTKYSILKMSFSNAIVRKADGKILAGPLVLLWLHNFLLYLIDNDNIAPADSNASPGLILIHGSCFPAPCNASGTIDIRDQDLNVQKTVNFGASGVGLFVDDATVHKDGTLYLVGDTMSNNLPQTNSFQPTRKGNWEGFVMRFAPPDLAVTLSSYVGGSGDDFAGDVAVDNAGNIFVAGQTSSKNFPTTGDASKRNLTGTADGFVIKITP